MRQARLPTGIDCRTRIGRRPGQAAPSWMTAGVACAATWDRSGSFRPFGGIEVRGYLRINLVTGETVFGRRTDAEEWRRCGGRFTSDYGHFAAQRVAETTGGH